LQRLFNGKLEQPKSQKDKDISNEEIMRLADAVRLFQKSELWLKVIQPYIENSVINEACNLFNNGVEFNNEQKNIIIANVRFALGFKNRLKQVETEGELAKQRFLKKQRPKKGLIYKTGDLKMRTQKRR